MPSSRSRPPVSCACLVESMIRLPATLVGKSQDPTSKVVGVDSGVRRRAAATSQIVKLLAGIRTCEICAIFAGHRQGHFAEKPGTHRLPARQLSGMPARYLGKVAAFLRHPNRVFWFSHPRLIDAAPLPRGSYSEARGTFWHASCLIAAFGGRNLQTVVSPRTGVRSSCLRCAEPHVCRLNPLEVRVLE